jgi:hypothetical protein
MTSELSTGPLDITAAVATLAPAVKISAETPAMMTLRPILAMFSPLMMGTREHHTSEKDYQARGPVALPSLS